MSQFDDLLADLGDLPGLKTSAPATGADDDFDPFGPSAGTADQTAAGDSGLLLDFTTSDSQVHKGQTSNGVDQPPSDNPLYDMSAQSSNPLYDLSNTSGENPLYDLTSTEGDSNPEPPANPLYDFEVTTTTTTSSSDANPLYEFETKVEEEPQQVDQNIFGNSQGLDLLSGTNTIQEVQEEEFTGTKSSPEVDLISSPTAEDRVQSGQFDDMEYLQDQQHQEFTQEQQEPAQVDSSFTDTFVVTQEEIIDDGVTVATTTRNDFSGSGHHVTTEDHSSNQYQDQSPKYADYSPVKDDMKGPKQTVDIQQEVMASEGGVYENQPQTFQQWQNEEEEEEGVHESQPVTRDDVARESDRDIGAELPAVGTASSIRAKFLASQPSESSRSKREITPPAHGSGGEYVSEPRTVLERYEGKAEAGVFESQPQQNPDVVTSDMALEETLPEQGFARNVAAKFRELESKGSVPVVSGKREITPDRSGQVEYVSEPRNQMEHYEGHAESGVFESQPVVNPEVVRSGQEVEEQLPERGMAKNLAQKFRQISTDTSSPSQGRAKREITPDTSGRVEYVSEPRGYVETYTPKADAGVFESQPQVEADVVKSDDLPEEYIPERGFARNVAAKFRELESSAKSPPMSPGRRKEFTPPREESGKRESGVYESRPEVKAEVVHAEDSLEEALPERGTAKNMAQRFRQLEADNRSPHAPKPKKEFTPPPADSGVFENQPDQFKAEYNQPAESGIVENQPVVREDVVKGTEPPKYEEELPERGMARNLVSRWRQMENEGTKVVSPGSGGRQKEFTPPREEPRIKDQRSPRTPMSPTNGSMDNGSVHPSELPGQYQPSQEPNVFESNPDRRPDVVREDDTDWTEGMPKKDTAKKMLARFQKIQSEAKEQEAKEHTPRRDSEEASDTEPQTQPPCQPDQQVEPHMEQARLKFEDPSQVGRSKSMRAAIQTEKCGACEKTVYAMERLEMNKRVYHKACFRCSKCKSVLTPKTFAINNDVIFCTNHYKQLFATKGNYDEGFGRMQHKKRWNSNPNLAAEGAAVNGQDSNGTS